jgi:hypothetical protein
MGHGKIAQRQDGLIRNVQEFRGIRNVDFNIANCGSRSFGMFRLCKR